MTLLKKGQHYYQTWPQEKQLAPFFPEYRVCKVTRFGIVAMPPFAVFILCWQIGLGDSLGIAVAMALFACSLPLQGFFWLGRRATSHLPLALADWFYSIREKLIIMEPNLEKIESPLTYQHLANLLSVAFKRLDKTFWDEI